VLAARIFGICGTFRQQTHRGVRRPFPAAFLNSGILGIFGCLSPVLALPATATKLGERPSDDRWSSLGHISPYNNSDLRVKGYGEIALRLVRIDRRSCPSS